MKPRAIDADKRDFGHAYLIVGSCGKMGAAVIAARACLRTGCGLLTLNVPIQERWIVQNAIPEAMLILRTKKEENEKQQSNQLDLHYFTAVGIGSGIGTTAAAHQLLLWLLNTTTPPLVLDADALNMMTTDKTLWHKIPKNTILTPHHREFDRLFGAHGSAEARTKTAIKKAKKHQVVIVLKSHQTLITDGRESVLNSTGNVGLAKGGSGDALTGIITSFLAQGYAPLEAAKIGVYLHGLAADVALKKQSLQSLLITDVIECLGKAFTKIQKYKLL